jgi:predicted TPR repeat methyltransferase
MPTSLISDLFDHYANNFDTHLVQKLEYRTPNLLFELVRARRSAKRLNILDLGCGTGLAGAQFKSVANAWGRSVFQNVGESEAARNL